MIDELKKIFNRDLAKLKEEIGLYQNEKNIWVKDGNIANSAGNLCLHLIGNLNAYVGAGLANTGYIRHREEEFTVKNIPRDELIRQVEATQKVVQKGLENVTKEELTGNFPIVIWEEPSSMTFILIHLATHLNYHLGQINYHRRLVDV